jgi:hypothetical protein
LFKPIFIIPIVGLYIAFLVMIRRICTNLYCNEDKPPARFIYYFKPSLPILPFYPSNISNPEIEVFEG